MKVPVLIINIFRQDACKIQIVQRHLDYSLIILILTDETLMQYLTKYRSVLPMYGDAGRGSDRPAKNL